MSRGQQLEESICRTAELNASEYEGFRESQLEVDSHREQSFVENTLAKDESVLELTALQSRNQQQLGSCI